MKINITGHHVEVTDAIRSVVNSKFDKLNHHFPDVSILNVILTVEKHEQIAEVSTHFLGQDFSATAKHEDMYQSIADMTNKLTTLLQRQKDKVKSHSHQKPPVAEEEIVDDK
jgi:putative sigma-54 modulation protein